MSTVPVKSNPWVDRFSGLRDLESIRKHATVPPVPISAEVKLPPGVVHDYLQHALKSFYLPSRQDLEILKTLIDAAVSHCMLYYADNETYLRTHYEGRHTPFMPFCLTGYSGVGKSELIWALKRIFPADQKVEIGCGHESIRTTALWSVTFGPEKTASKVLRGLVETPVNRISSSDPEVVEKRKLCPRMWAYQHGVSMMVVDELQFLTKSENANTMVTAALLDLCDVGVPFVYVANYSLGHRLSRREQEDRQRILSRPLILLPDAADSQDWLDFISACTVAGGRYLAIDVKKDAEIIHRYSAGIRRVAVRLLVTAYQRAAAAGRSSATVSDIEVAYLSAEFSDCRRDIEEITSHIITGNLPSLTLRCPFELPVAYQAQLRAKMLQRRQQVVSDELLKSALNKTERSKLDAIVAESKPEKPVVAPMPKKACQRVTVESLLGATEKFKESMERGKR